MSSVLTSEQQDWYEQRFGKRYSRVQEQPLRPSRRVRRGRARDKRDLAVQRAQEQTLEQLRRAPLSAEAT